MYELKPQRTNNKAQSLIILFFAGAAALFLLSVFMKGMPFLWVIQLFAILLLVAAVFIVTRYVTKTFIYSIDVIDGQADLSVTEVSSGGRRQITVCRIGLSSIKSVKVSEGKDETVSLLRKERKRMFDYRPDINPEKSILLVSDEGGDELLILLAYDEELLRILQG